MKPNDFKLNSDYLTLANVENKTIEVVVPAVQIPNTGYYSATYNFRCKSIPIAITRAYMHHSTMQNPKLYGYGRFGNVVFRNSSQDVFSERISLTTPTSDTLRVTIEIQGTVGKTAPGHTITIKAFRFVVPNVF